MIIRSQDKLKLIPLADGYVGIFGRGVFLVPHSDARSIELGMYSSEEKALKVLDIIQQTYSNSMEMLSEELISNGYWLGVKNNSNVFQMPQEDEV